MRQNGIRVEARFRFFLFQIPVGGFCQFRYHVLKILYGKSRIEMAVPPPAGLRDS